jgi:Resolvase, N terminal domain
MPRPHPFATAPAPKGRARAVKPPKLHVTNYGYARVSTGGQSVDAQAQQLRAAGAVKVFREVASGAKTDRPQLARLVSELAAGDVVMVTRLDRLASRNQSASASACCCAARQARAEPSATSRPAWRTSHCHSPPIKATDRSQPPNMAFSTGKPPRSQSVNHCAAVRVTA